MIIELGKWGECQMSKMLIMDLEVRKYKTVKCPICNDDEKIGVNNVIKDDFDNDVTEYICNNCEEIFELDEQETTYEEGSYGEDEWKDFTEEMISFIEDDEQ